MNMPSHYQNDLFEELSRRYDNFEVVYARTHDDARKKLGWNFENSDSFRSKFIGQELKIWQMIPYIFKHRKATHIVNGIWAESIFFIVIIFLNLFQSNFLIYSEAPNPSKNRSLMKRIIIFYSLIPISKLLIYKAKGFLSVSELAFAHFKKLGIKAEKIYRFGYFLNIKKQSKNIKQSLSPSFIFVGQLTERKGILTLLKAVKKLSEQRHSFHLSIIGSGDLEQNIQEYLQANELQNFITLLGAIDAKKVSEYIYQADLLILPSVFDGWGIVVNEALQNGIPALVSDQCGAKELIRNRQNGLIFEANNVNKLTQKLSDFIVLSPQEISAMKQQAEKTGATLEIDSVVQYLTDCINHSLNTNHIKPTAPWLK
jgi:glycosyltransferase involved in cell wall biosynthesis